MDYSLSNELRSIYLENNSLASAGKKTIDNYLSQNDAAGLLNILRSHEEKDITNNETWIRDEIDYFIEYFSIISLALITGYISKNDVQELKGEIMYYLGNAAVKRYYTVNYPLLLPQILLESTIQNKYFDISKKEPKKIISDFETFHILNQTIENADVNQFLWFLDGGRNDGFDIDDLKQILKSTKKLRQFLLQSDKNALKESVNGFFDYLIFLEKFKEFLDQVENGTDKAAYWSFHQYWFLRIGKKLKTTIDSFYKGLQNFTKIEFENKEQLNMISQISQSRDNYELILSEILFNTHYPDLFQKFIDNWQNENLTIPQHIISVLSAMEPPKILGVEIGDEKNLGVKYFNMRKEIEIVMQALQAKGLNVTDAAKILQIDKKTLSKIIKTNKESESY